MLPFSIHFFCNVSVLFGCLKPLSQRLPLINAMGKKEFHLFPLELQKPWRWHGQCWRRSVLVGLQLTAPADPWGRDTGLSPLFQAALGRRHCVRDTQSVFGKLPQQSKAQGLPETSSPADIFLLHQFSNWPLLDFSRLPDYIQCRSTNE